LLQDLHYRAKLEREKLALEESAAAEETLVGESPPMKEVMRLVAQCAAGDDPVTIRGENGTGKELVARTIHLMSRRRSGPFVAVNFGGLDPAEIEPALFGLAGANPCKAALERAHGGTLLLDEAGEMNPELQDRLKKFFHEGTLLRAGGTEPIRADVRVVLATTRPRAADGADLFQGVEIVIPPLRERMQDFPLLVHHFVSKYAAKIGKRMSGADPDALDALQRRPWPGNVRELENLIERAVMLSGGPTVRREDLS
jgi:DNA-binding NtrC family response regulator